MTGMQRHLVSRVRLLVTLTVVAFVSTTATLTRADETARGFVDRVFKDDAGSHKYVVFVPEAYTADKSWPVILFLHGAGERGTDGKKQTQVGLGPLVKSRAKSFPFVVVFPQSENLEGRLLTGWEAKTPDSQRALAILDAVEKDYRIDPKRRVLTGWSMGGVGTWSVAAATPKRWSAVVPLAGGGDPMTVASLKSMPVWAFHGGQDGAILPGRSQEMVDALRKAGGRVTYTEVPQAGHDVWKTAYDNDTLYDWMLDPSQDPAALAKLNVRPGDKPPAQLDTNAPFKPALEMPRALHVRLGNDMLETLSYSIPKRVPKELLSGRLADIRDTTVAQGRTFNVTFTGITYSGKVTRAHVKAYKKGRLNFQLGFENLHMQIGTTYVNGSGKSAVAGPMSVVIGHRKPVWLSVVVSPYVEKQQLKLKLVATRFDIPNDNWYVTAPRGVSTKGLGMTREKVSSALVSGLYGSKSRIQREVTDIVPSIVGQLEKNLDLGEVTDLVTGFWPLPVLRPRLRVWPENVVVDEQGVSLWLGLTAAAVDPALAPKVPRRVAPLDAGASNLSSGTKLEVGVAPAMLEPLTQLLIDANVARIHVCDIPEKTFSRFADPQALSNAIPELKRLGDDVEVWAELVLASPLRVENDESIAKNNPASKIKPASSTKVQIDPKTPMIVPERLVAFAIPRLLISTAIRRKGSQDAWRPFVEFEFNVRQASRVTMQASGFVKRSIRMDWTGKPVITAKGRFAPGYEPQDKTIDTNQAQGMFATAWNAWAASGPMSEASVADVAFETSKLRLSGVEWNAPHILARFAAAGVKISNRTDQPLVYETKGPHTGWGGPYTLEPNDDHEFEVSYPLTYRHRLNGKYRLFILSSGSHSEFRLPEEGSVPSLFQVREALKRTAD
jgi:poly(3-hydroxybutyrate) depolymerase